jgi:nucleotide-binding universal stress UspA family protein
VDEGRLLGARLGLFTELLHVAELDRGAWRFRPSVQAWLALTGVSDAMIVTRTGTPWVEIVRHAQEIDASLLVIGSHGESGFHPLRIGSTAERLGSAAPCPLVLVSGRGVATARPVASHP